MQFASPLIVASFDQDKLVFAELLPVQQIVKAFLIDLSSLPIRSTNVLASPTR